MPAVCTKVVRTGVDLEELSDHSITVVLTCTCISLLYSESEEITEGYHRKAESADKGVLDDTPPRVSSTVVLTCPCIPALCAETGGRVEESASQRGTEPEDKGVLDDQGPRLPTGSAHAEAAHPGHSSGALLFFLLSLFVDPWLNVVECLVFRVVLWLSQTLTDRFVD